MSRWRTVAVAYALLGSIAATLALALRAGSPFIHPSPWLALDGWSRHVTSLVLGVALAVAVVASTRIAVDRWRWARKLHAELRPLARDLSPGTVVLVAVFSSFGEELFFRGLLTPLLGVIAQSILFGLAHQLQGPSRWVWIAWAVSVGLAFGALFALTGSLVGPLIAHAAINGYNLRFLRVHDPGLKERRLGGLLAPFDA